MTWITKGADHGSILGNEQNVRQVGNAIRDMIESAHTGQPLASQ